MKLFTPAFENGMSIPSRYSYLGGNIRPELCLEQIPQNTQSLAFVIEDPDAPSGVWIHWLSWNVPVVHRLSENELPISSVQGLTSWGHQKYDGPCPPSGTHRYFFKAYALGGFLELDSSAAIEELKEAMKGKVLAEAEWMGLFSAP